MSPTFLRFLGLLAVVAGCVAGKRIVVDSYSERELYRKDFVQEYLLARAVVDGVDLYLPAPELASVYFEPPPKLPWAHPAPHPPTAAVASVPIGLFPYGVAVTVWLAFEVGCLAWGIATLARWWGEPVGWTTRAALFLVALACGPVVHELWFGQFSLLLFVLTTIAWLRLREGRDALGGAALGLAVTLKLAAWPVGLYLAFAGRWRAVAAAAGVFAVGQLSAALVVGPRTVVEYYTNVGPSITRDYAKHDENFSLWTVGPRFFSAEVARVASSFITPELWPSESAAQMLTKGLPLAALAGALALAARSRRFDTAFGVLLCAGLPLNPVVWDHYLLMTAVPAVVVFRRLKDLAFPRGATSAALVGLVVAALPNPGYLELAVWLFATGDAYNVKILPFAAGLVTYVPLVPIALWIVLLVRTDAPPVDAR